MSLEEYFGDWLEVMDVPALTDVVNKLNYQYSTHKVVPEYEDIFKAFTLCSLHELRIVFLGQDPYPQRGVATGVLFGNKEGTLELSPSLEVIREACIDYTVPHRPISFDVTLESWARQGILMINSALTCEMNKVGSHVMLWRPFITKLVKNISECHPGTIFVLFGSQAQTFEPYISKKFNYIIKVQHPAFFARIGRRMPHELFTKLDSLVKEIYGEPIQWYTYLLT